MPPIFGGLKAKIQERAQSNDQALPPNFRNQKEDKALKTFTDGKLDFNVMGKRLHELNRMAHGNASQKREAAQFTEQMLFSCANWKAVPVELRVLALDTVGALGKLAGPGYDQCVYLTRDPDKRVALAAKHAAAAIAADGGAPPARIPGRRDREWGGPDSPVPGPAPVPPDATAAAGRPPSRNPVRERLRLP